MAEADLRETKQPLDEVHIKQRMLLRRDMQNIFEFTSCNNAECLPEICNEFITVFMAGREQGTNRLEAN